MTTSLPSVGSFTPISFSSSQTGSVFSGTSSLYTFRFTLASAPYTVCLQTNNLTGKKTILLNGFEIRRCGSFFTDTLNETFTVGGVQVCIKDFGDSYDLLVEGRSFREEVPEQSQDNNNKLLSFEDQTQEDLDGRLL